MKTQPLSALYAFVDAQLVLEQGEDPGVTDDYSLMCQFPRMKVERTAESLEAGKLEDQTVLMVQMG